MSDQSPRETGEDQARATETPAEETPAASPADALTPEEAEQPSAPQALEDPEASETVFTLHEIAEDSPAPFSLLEQSPHASAGSSLDSSPEASPPADSSGVLPAEEAAAGGPPAPPAPPPVGAEADAPRTGDDGGNKEDRSDSENAPEKSMTLLDHLGELRARLVRGFVAVVIAFGGCYSFAGDLFHWLALPLLKVMPADSKFIYTGVAEGFFVDLKVSFVAALFVASPFLFYQIWAFIAPGLYDEEKRYAIPLALCSAVFFIGGASFCYLVVFPFAFTFFLSYSTDSIVAMLSINEYLSFSLKMLIAFGLIFEMPLFAFFLARMGLITARTMRRVRKYAVLGVFVVAAILTPPDVFSQILMALPMLLLYEVSILVAAVAGRKEKKAKDAGQKDAGRKDTETHEPQS